MSSASKEPELMQKIVSLCKRRGFVFQSSEVYGGLKSAYDYGPMGVELKRNLMNEWWRFMVTSRDNVVGLESSIIMHPEVWRSSGHVGNFNDPLVDCNVCQERFRADKAPKIEEGQPVTITLGDKGRAKLAFEKIKELAAEEGATASIASELKRDGKSIVGVVAGDRGYVCPNCGSPFLAKERNFNGMFRTNLGPVDPMQNVIDALKAGIQEGKSDEELKAVADNAMVTSAVYLRPETAQGMFVQFSNVQQSQSAKVPFGIAQMGKSFRNEVTVEHFIFRSCEFEQMEMEFFCPPGEGPRYLEYWKDQRMSWWESIGLSKEKLMFREHEQDELAHYSDGTFDVEYEFPWGWDELEGVASRTDYDLKAHAKGAGKKIEYFDPEAINPETGKKGWRYVPHVVEPAAGATRGVLAVLCNAYTEEFDENNQLARTVLKLHPRLAPYKVAVLPLVKKDEELVKRARKIAEEFLKAGIPVKYDEQHTIGKRYARHDEIGTPYCLTVDNDSLEDNSVTIRYRDDKRQERIAVDQVIATVQEALATGKL
ncbi:MAG: glycine--tRNA ligase [Polyangiaceae bacterium]|nr:glycine--tRNA ligase [Polyangiaceae bacterium]